MSAEHAAPFSPPLAIELGGILDGRTADPASLAAAARELGACGLGTFQCEQTGGRFSLLPESTELPGAGFDLAAQERFLAGLARVAECALPGSIECTLHCRLIGASEVVETLFVLKEGRLEPMSRTRPRSPQDRVPFPESAAAGALKGMRARDLALLALVLLLLGSLAVWRTGLVGRVLAVRAEALPLDNGPFGSTLALESKLSWGSYEVTLRRGTTFPQDPAQLAKLAADAPSLEERAAVTAVGDGGEIWVLLCDREGEVLEASSVSLRQLLLDAESKPQAVLAGHMEAAQIRLSMSSKPAAKPK